MPEFTPPAEIVLIRDHMGHGTNCFSTFGEGRFGRFSVRGLELKEVYEKAGHEIGGFVSRICGRECVYEPELSFDDYKAALKTDRPIYAKFVLMK